MSLPTSRPRTYVLGMPAIPDDINELFDASIDAKHPLLTIPIAPCEWTSGNAIAVYNPVNGWFGFGGGGDSAYVGLRIPVGTRLTGAKWNFNRTSGLFNFKIRKKPANGAWANIVTGTDNATAGVGTKILACTEIIAVDTQYELYVDTAAAGVLTFDAVSYFIDRL